MKQVEVQYIGLNYAPPKLFMVIQPAPEAKGLRAEGPRAVTDRRCSHSGEGEDFLMRGPGFFLRVFSWVFTK